jgi:hypothetical protein
MFQQQGLGWRMPFFGPHVGAGVLAAAAAGAVGGGAIVAVNVASSQGTQATAVGFGPIAIAHPVLNTRDSIDLQNAAAPALDRAGHVPGAPWGIAFQAAVQPATTTVAGTSVHVNGAPWGDLTVQGVTAATSGSVLDRAGHVPGAPWGIEFQSATQPATTTVVGTSAHVPGAPGAT